MPFPLNIRLPQCLSGENGQTLVEYVLILSLVSIAALAASPIGQWAETALGKVATSL
jgi:Flp pilus assembly pilin Flp